MSRILRFRIAILLVPMIFSVLGPYALPDLGFWIVQGREFLEHGSLVAAHARGALPVREFIHCSWLIAIIYSAIERSLGLLSACLIHSMVLVPFIFALIYRESLFRLKGSPDQGARWILYLVWLGSVPLMTERPWLFSFIPLLFSYREISRIRDLADFNTRRTLRLFLLMVFWVNVHGSFPLLGLMLVWKVGALGLRSFGSPGFFHALLPLMGRLGVIASGSLINPFFWKVIPDVFETVRTAKLRGIREWQGPVLSWEQPEWIFYFLLLIGVVIWIARNYRSRAFLDKVSDPFFLILILGSLAVRNAALCFVLLLPAAYRLGWISEEKTPVSRGSLERLGQTLQVPVLLLLLCFATPWFRSSPAGGILPERFRAIYEKPAPFGFAKVIQESGKKCAVFSGWYLGGFFRYALPNPTFVDGRNTPFSDEVFEKYSQARRGEAGWEDYLKQYGACFAVLSPEDEPTLVALMSKSSEWREVGREDGVILFELATRVSEESKKGRGTEGDQ